MTETWYFCDECNEWFAEEVKTCPDCGSPRIVKKCANCRLKVEECTCK